MNKIKDLEVINLEVNKDDKGLLLPIEFKKLLISI